MNTFELVIDQKESCWSRQWVKVEAKTQEEAVEKYHLGDYITVDSEILEFTGEISDEIIMDSDYNEIS